MDGEEPTMTTTAKDVHRIPLHEQPWFKILIWILYSVIFLFGVGGNTVVCFVLYRKKSLRTVTNLFILNLAISDLIFSGSIPLEFPIILNNYEWPYASFFCKIYSPTQTIALSVSISTLTAVSIIRYRAIKHPLKRQVSIRHANYIVIGIWIFSFLLLVPHMLTSKITENKCGEEWPNVTYRKIYTTSLFALFYVIPLFIIVFTYTTIVTELMKKRNHDNSALNEAWNRETASVIRMFFKVTLVFAACNLPSQLMWLWLDFGNADRTFAHFRDLLSGLNILIFANSAANPFIYFICHDRFRNQAMAFLSNCQWLIQLRNFCSRNEGRRADRESLNIEEKKYNVAYVETLENTQSNRSTTNMIDKTDETSV